VLEKSVTGDFSWVALLGPVDPLFFFFYFFFFFFCLSFFDGALLFTASTVPSYENPLVLQVAENCFSGARYPFRAPRGSLLTPGLYLFFPLVGAANIMRRKRDGFGNRGAPTHPRGGLFHFKISTSGSLHGDVHRSPVNRVGKNGPRPGSLSFLPFPFFPFRSNHCLANPGKINPHILRRLPATPLLVLSLHSPGSSAP